jgi:hypothetical protein
MKTPNDSIDIGPQNPGEDSFAMRMRFHQSWYRAAILGVPCGTGPRTSDARQLGNMLRRADGERGLNFLSPQIFEVVQAKLNHGEGLIEEYRLLHNMLSSQPMCFNLFGPMVADLDLATAVFRELVPDEIDRVTHVDIEYAPDPKEEFLDDRTAFDAFVEFDRVDGTRGFVGIETKLTEPFSRKTYDGKAYRRWVERADSPWPKESWSPPDRLAHIRHNQLWRDHLLAVAMLRHPQSPYESGYLLLVRHLLDEQCESTADSYRQLLKPSDSTFVDCSLDRLLAVIEECAGRTHGQWIAGFRERYVSIEGSEDVWRTGHASA